MIRTIVLLMFLICMVTVEECMKIAYGIEKIDMPTSSVVIAGVLGFLCLMFDIKDVFKE